ncbi:MAG TPA: hypothetical protein VMZ91_16805 [Candidatus Paceibacterota bacterium]|nr:hypothetical protein [Candidatus Paceibacterota bacterium]
MIEKIKIKVKRLEKGLGKFLKVTFETKFGEYPLKVKKEKLDLFCPGKEYQGIFRVNGIPDFIGAEAVWGNICTVNYNLKKILDNGKLIYEK